MAAKGKRFCWTEAGQPVEESISTAMARQGSVKIVWILSLGLICSSFFCFQEFPFKYFLSMMLDNLFEIQVIEQKFMLNVKVALCDVVLKMSFSRSTVAFPILLGLASARPYSFFFFKLCIYANTFVHIIPELASPEARAVVFAKSKWRSRLVLPPPAELCVYPNLKKTPWRQHPPTVLAVLTVKPKAVGAFPLFLSLWPWPSTAIRLLGGLQCAKAFNGFMSSCDLGPDPWGWKCRYHVSDMPPRWNSGWIFFQGLLTHVPCIPSFFPAFFSTLSCHSGTHEMLVCFSKGQRRLVMRPFRPTAIQCANAVLHLWRTRQSSHGRLGWLIPGVFPARWEL